MWDKISRRWVNHWIPKTHSLFDSAHMLKSKDRIKLNPMLANEIAS
jgi:hypothetical protein